MRDDNHPGEGLRFPLPNLPPGRRAERNPEAIQVQTVDTPNAFTSLHLLLAGAVLLSLCVLIVVVIFALVSKPRERDDV